MFSDSGYLQTQSKALAARSLRRIGMCVGLYASARRAANVSLQTYEGLEFERRL